MNRDMNWQVHLANVSTISAHRRCKSWGHWKLHQFIQELRSDSVTNSVG